MPNLFKRSATSLLQSVAERASRRTVERLTESSLADEIAYRAASETVLHDLQEDETPCKRLGSVSDGFWFWLLTEGCRRNAAIRRFLPGMPGEEVQLRYTGDAGDVTLREGFQAYTLFRDLFEQHHGGLKPETQILDYGCGWGRIIRFFLKDVSPVSLVGADPVEDVLAIAGRTNRWCRFEKIPFTPPSPLPANSFDLVYSFSVFSHLSEDRHKLLLADLARVLKPGGLMMVTTRNRGFIDYCASLRGESGLADRKPGHTSSAVAFPDTEKVKMAYDAGEYCFHSFNAGGEWDHWGETAIPKGYVERVWTRDLQFMEFFDDPERLAQVVVVMRKPSHS